MQNVALYWLILSLTHSPIAVGMLSLARFGPFTLLRALRRAWSPTASTTAGR